MSEDGPEPRKPDPSPGATPPPTPPSTPPASPPTAPTADDAVPGGPWRSWSAIYISLAVWGVICILFLIWMTATMNSGVAGAPAMDAAPAAEALP